MYKRKADYIAKYVIEMCIELDSPIQNRSLQVVLYSIQKSFISEFGEKAFYDDIEYWRLGPAVPTVYYEYSSYGALPIIFNSEPEFIEKFRSENSKEKVALIDKIIESSIGKDLWSLLEKYNNNEVVYSNEL